MISNYLIDKHLVNNYLIICEYEIGYIFSLALIYLCLIVILNDIMIDMEVYAKTLHFLLTFISWFSLLLLASLW